jgi:hypothetical protein
MYEEYLSARDFFASTPRSIFEFELMKYTQTESILFAVTIVPSSSFVLLEFM